ncbi:MAG: hypothetical protein FJ303_25290 [Planctomycetes bacterium]|nr:hypothetical protein [Planctomycetota bacterium]
MRLGMLFVIGFLACNFTAAAPVRKPLGPPPTEEIEFRESRWIGKTYEGNTWIIVFHADGKVTNTDGSTTYKNSGNWRALGTAIHMDLNNKYYEFRGIVVGDQLDGDSSNVTGLRWKTSFRRMDRN